MFRYLMVSGSGNGRMTVAIFGDAVFTHAAEMQEALTEALDSCDHLTVDVVAAEDVDLTFRVLLCSLHRRSELINKRITVQVAQTPGREERPGQFARVEGCLFKDASELCTLWHGTGDGRR